MWDFNAPVGDGVWNSVEILSQSASLGVQRPSIGVTVTTIHCRPRLFTLHVLNLVGSDIILWMCGQ